MATSTFNGPIWNIALSHAEVDNLVQAAGTANTAWVTGLLPAPPPQVIAAIDASVAYIVIIDQLGGKQGVDITIVVGTAGCVVSPQGSGIFPALSHAAGVAIDAGKTIGDFIAKSVSAGVTALTSSIWVGIAVGGPAVAAADIARKAISIVFGGGSPPPAPIGGVSADALTIDAASTFVLSTSDDIKPGYPGIPVTLLEGFFCPQNGGGRSIWANTGAVGQLEHLRLSDNGDGTVSIFCYATGIPWFFRAEYGGGNVCQWDSKITNYPETSFRIIPQANGKIALQTYNATHYVKVSS